MATRRSVVSGSRSTIGGAARKAFAIEGFKELQDKFAAVIDAPSAKEAKQLYYEQGRILRNQARENAPYDPGRKKGTHLKDAIFVSAGPEEKPDVLVGVRYKAPGAPHAHLVEFGTSKMPANPFFRKAIAQAGPTIASNIKSGLIQIIEKAAKK
jgi:HK97 gp10 family phage protein